MTHWKIVAAGEGGQGVQALAETLAMAAYRLGRHALYIPNFGIEQRGGVSMALVQISREEIGSPKFLTADLLAALSARSLERCRSYLGPKTVVLYDNSLIAAPVVADYVVGLQSYDTIAPEAFAEKTGYEQERGTSLRPSPPDLLVVPAADLARRLLHPRVFNMIILGAVSAILGSPDLEAIREALEEKLNRRFAADPRLREHNFQALEIGYDAAIRQLRAAQPVGGR